MMIWYRMVWYGYRFIGLLSLMGTRAVTSRKWACDDMVWYGMVWYGMVWYGMVWYVMVWYGMVWYGMVWYGKVWYGMVWPDI